MVTRFTKFSNLFWVDNDGMPFELFSNPYPPIKNDDELRKAINYTNELMKKVDKRLSDKEDVSGLIEEWNYIYMEIEYYQKWMHGIEPIDH